MYDGWGIGLGARDSDGRASAIFRVEMTMRSFRTFVSCAVVLVPGVIAAGAARGADPVLVARTASLQKVTGGLAFSEGPIWHKDGYLLFEDIPLNRIMRLGRDGKVDVFREPSGRANGLTWDTQGRLIAAEGAAKDGGRRVSRTMKDGKDGAKGAIVTVADKYDGKPLNSPNDVTVDGRGRIYFTDPRYGDRAGVEQDKEAVYRIDGNGRVTRIIDSLTRPNGIVVTRDGKTLYVADNAAPATTTLNAFDLDAEGNAHKGRVIHDLGGGRGIDGMTIDTKGRIWATAGDDDRAGVYVFEPDAQRSSARLLTVIKTPEAPTNCTFGGEKRDTLYITTATSLYRIRTAAQGVPNPPGK